MPLDPGDPYYRAELISPTIAAMEHPLCDAFGVGLGNFGSKGNENHLSGYHRSRNWILNSPDSAHGSGDYSIQLGLDKGNNDDVAAFDFTPGVWGSSDNRSKMKLITQRLLTACQNHDLRVANLREFAGTLDGSHVITWDCSRNAFKTPFDSSHLDHVHGSIYRTKTRADHSGIVSVMLGQTIGDDMFLRTPNGSIYLAAGGAVVQVLGSELGGISPQSWTTVPQSLVDRLAAATSGTAPTAAEIAAQVVAQLPAGTVDESTVLAALQSPEGQAALVQAANTAEDS
jgi:hypothetical protein